MGISTTKLRYRGVWLMVGYGLLLSIIYLSVTSRPPQLDLAFPYQDKLSHVLAYFVLTAWFAQLYPAVRLRIMQAVLFTGMGLVLEYVQSLDPARQAEFADMLANAAGAGLACLLSIWTGLGSLLQRFEKQLFKSSE